MAPVDDESSVTMPSYSTRLDKAQILLEADEFVTKHNLHDARDLIRKGALLFYDLHDYTRVEDLTEDEIAALHNGKENAGSSTAWAFCGLAGLLYALLGLSLRMDDYSNFWNPSHKYRYGVLLVAIPLLEHPFAVLLSTRIGRRKALYAASIFAMLKACLAVIPGSFGYWFSGFAAPIVDRLLCGIAMATLMYTAPLHLAEHGQASSQGRAMTAWYMYVFMCIAKALHTNVTSFKIGQCPPATVY